MEVNQRPIPPPHDEDDEDVNWALSTASALWSRGEREEALRWLRRAAEQASDANADSRALELFKAAAEVAATLSTSEATPAPSGAASSASSGGWSTLSRATASVPPSRKSIPSPETVPTGALPPRSGASMPLSARSVRPPSLPIPDLGGWNRMTPSAPPGPPERPAAPSGSHPRSAPPGHEAAPEPMPTVGSRPPLPDGARDRRASVAPKRMPAVSVLSAPPLPQSREIGLPKSVAPVAPERSSGVQSARAPERRPSAAPIPEAQPSFLPGPSAARSRSTPVSSVPPGHAMPELKSAVAFPGGDGELRGVVSKARVGPTEADRPTSAAMSRERPAASTSAHEASPALKELPPIRHAQRSAQDHSAAIGQAAPPTLKRMTHVQIGSIDARSAPAQSGSVDVGAYDDEITMPRDVNALRREHREFAGLRTEDPEAETRELDGRASESEQRPPSTLQAEVAAPERELSDSRHWAGALPSDGPVADLLSEQTAPRDSDAANGTRALARLDVADPPAEMEGGTADEWNQSTEPVHWRAPAPRLPTSPIEPLPAVRVAVIGTSRAGELRLVPLDGRTAPPMGSALGILVPLSAADGEALVRLLARGD